MILDEMFAKYPNNLIGFRLNQSVKIIDFYFKREWEFPTVNEDVKFLLQKQKETPDGLDYYVLMSEDLTFEELFNAFGELIEPNLALERKEELFHKKIEELKALFLNTSYDDLKNLQFDTVVLPTLFKQEKEETV